MGISKIVWEIGSQKTEASGLLVRPILIESGGLKRRSRLSIVRLSKGYTVRLIEGVGNQRVTHTIPADSLSEAMATVRYIIEGSYLRSDGKILGKFAGVMKTLLEVEI